MGKGIEESKVTQHTEVLAEERRAKVNLIGIMVERGKFYLELLDMGFTKKIVSDDSNVSEKTIKRYTLLAENEQLLLKSDKEIISFNQAFQLIPKAEPKRKVIGHSVSDIPAEVPKDSAVRQTEDVIEDVIDVEVSKGVAVQQTEDEIKEVDLEPFLKEIKKKFGEPYKKYTECYYIEGYDLFASIAREIYPLGMASMKLNGKDTASLVINRVVKETLVKLDKVFSYQLEVLKLLHSMYSDDIELRDRTLEAFYRKYYGVFVMDLGDILLNVVGDGKTDTSKYKGLNFVRQVIEKNEDLTLWELFRKIFYEIAEGSEL